MHFLKKGSNGKEHNLNASRSTYEVQAAPAFAIFFGMDSPKAHKSKDASVECAPI